MTYSIAPKQIRDSWVAEVYKISNPTGSELIFSGIVCSTEQAAIIKSARWLIDYMEIQLMSDNTEEEIPHA